MNLSALISLLDLAQNSAPAMLIGSFFPFLKKDKKPEVVAISKETLEAINKAAVHFLEVRHIENFRVYTIAYDNQPVILIQVAPQKKLRFSNIIEIQIKKYIRLNMAIEVPAIFWRFKTDNSETPGPEQADYETGEHFHPKAPTEDPAENEERAHLLEEAKEVGEPLEQDSAFIVPPHLAVRDLQVEEISMGEFEEFLKDTTSNDTKEPPQ